MRYLTVIIVLLLLFGCGGNLETPYQKSGSVEVQGKTLNIPPGVDPSLMRQLAAELEFQLAKHQPSAVPIQHLTPDTEVDGTDMWVFWEYGVNGDYDQNGEVNVADITPIAIDFQASDADADWNNNRMADGDGNGEVNLADITPIAINYSDTFGEYILESAPSAAGPWTEVGRYGLADGEPPAGGGLLAYDILVPGGATLVFQYIWTGTTGGGGNQAPVANMQADVTTGDAPLTVNLDASGSTDDVAVTDWEWDLDGDGTFNETDNGENTFNGNTNANYTFDTDGTYNPAVRVSDAQGLNNTTSVVITVGGGPTGPTFYVAPAASGGDDSNPGTQAEPWLTLQHAADTVVAGDTVIALAGDYAGFMLQTSGTAGSQIVFNGQGQANITSDNPNTTDGINLEDWSGAGIAYVTVQGFTVTGATRAGIRVTGLEENFAHHITLRNNICDQNGSWGIFSGWANDMLIEGNECSRSVGEHGIYLSNSGDRNVCRWNVCWGNVSSGIQYNGDASEGGDGIMSDSLIEYNIIYDNGTAGGAALNLDGVQDSIIRGNLLYNNHATGLVLYSGDGLAASGNVALNNTIIQPDDGRWCVSISVDSINNTLLNNILYSNHSFRGAIDIDTSSLPGFVSDYNAVIGRYTTDEGESVIDLAQWRLDTGQDTNSFIAVPGDLFVSPGTDDYHLLPGCLAINAGTTHADLPSVDLDLVVRPQESAIDIGAYESGGTGPVVYTASGNVFEADGTTPLAGVLVTITGDGSGADTTDGSGSWSVGNLFDGNYTATPNLGGWDFAPLNRAFAISATDAAVGDFVGSQLGTVWVTYSLNGKVYRIPAQPGATREDISAALDLLDTGTTQDDVYLNISPNGEWLVLVTNRFDPQADGWSGLAIVHADLSAGESVLVSGVLVHPNSICAVTNDGNTIIYVDTGGTNSEDLFVISRPNGSSPWGMQQELTGSSTENFHGHPAISADGTQVVFHAGPIQYFQMGSKIGVVNIDGSNLEIVLDPATNPLIDNYRHPDFAPDGSIVCEGEGPSLGEEIWRLPAGGGPPVQIGGHGNNNSPCVLPDGQIITLYIPGSYHELWRMSADGSVIELIIGDDSGDSVSDVGIGCGGG